MSSIITRRTALAGSLATGALFVAPQAFAKASGRAGGGIAERLAAIEASHGCRLGVAILDTAGEDLVGHRQYERFPLLSTFKFLAAAYVLARVDTGEEALDRRVVFTETDLVTYSPATEKRVGGEGMTMAEICEAAVTLSDNTAGNLMLDSFGGPEGLTRFLRSRGDAVSRLDRRETELNEARPGDVRDTTTPAAMIGHLRDLVVGDALTHSSREQLATWLLANTTGAKRLKAGLPSDWRIGDKTGTSDNDCANDVGVAYPPDRAPILVSVYLAEATMPVEDQNAAIAEVGRLVAGMV